MALAHGYSKAKSIGISPVFPILIGVALDLKIQMVTLKNHVEIKKRLTNPGEAITLQKKELCEVNGSVQK